MSAYRRINRGSRSLQPTFGNCSTTETTSSNSTASNSTSNPNDSLNNINKSLVQYDSNSSTDSLAKSGQQQAAAIKYDELQTSKFEHELSNGNGFTSYPMQPKHIRFPDVPYSSELVNELMIFLYTMIATAMQFLHLYRTVWWLPESNTSQTMNFYLIDEHLTMFIVILLGRRFMYCFLLGILEMICPKQVYHIALKFIRLTFFIGILSVLGYLCFEMFPKQRYIVIYLCYPMIVYVITFGMQIEPFLRTIFETESSTYFNGIPSHSCSTNPTVIRAEIDILRTDYNNRFKQVVFTSLLNAYYAAFIPCCFAQSFLYYDLYWATQHLGFLVLGGLTMCAMCCFPANYCDVMHMASLHLGKWSRVESRPYSPPAVAWSKLVVWPPGQYIKHSGELFKSYGVITTAIPGNGVHIRFYMFFQNPSNIYLILSIIQSVIVILQVVILFMVVEWHNIISLSYLVLANYHTLFKIVRDFFVTHRMYSSSKMHRS
ncbi:transmembrane protein 39A [Sitodiplosis mosellana]|uniref:transmembrane protein 39A n=1 Tax=Sitodiplosis mosellana TaxID=263140 RepID=UPI002444CA70|nr:transmembrane protein 39A [Sitodiplosis mosellana]XP_055318079.1 transmembrane protein 39A [Sitodiplosis mosellana]